MSGISKINSPHRLFFMQPNKIRVKKDSSILEEALNIRDENGAN